MPSLAMDERPGCSCCCRCGGQRIKKRPVRARSPAPSRQGALAWTADEEEQIEQTAWQPAGALLAAPLLWSVVAFLLLLRMFGGIFKKTKQHKKQEEPKDEEKTQRPLLKPRRLWCSVDGQRCNARPDGNCFWRSLEKARGGRARWRQHKREILRRAKEMGADRSWAAQQRRNGEWATSTTIAWTAQALGIQLVVDAGKRGTWSFGSTMSQPYFLSLRDCHFEAIKNPRICNTHHQAVEEAALIGGGFKEKMMEVQDDMAACISGLYWARRHEWEYKELYARQTCEWIDQVETQVRAATERRR